MGYDDLVPPAHMIFDGAASQENFVNVGEGFTQYYLVEHAHLKPNERVLDVGCGIGQKARALTRYLDSTGSYEGIDIVPMGIEWCKEKYKRYPNFHFQLADIFSTHYNPHGKYKAVEYDLPYQDKSFDLVFLSSVFTHMLPQDMENYFSEIARVLKSKGRCVITFFLLNSESLRRMDAGLNTIKIPFNYEAKAAICRIADPKSPETTVAHDEQYVRHLFDKNGLDITEITYGFWCGKIDLVGSLQDVIISVKE